jgi:hypothetical protein
VQLFNDLSEAGAIGCQTTRFFSRVRRQNQEFHLIVSGEADELHLAAESTLDGPFENALEDAVEALGSATHTQDESLAPLFHGQITEPDEGDLATQVLCPRLNARARAFFAQSVGDAASEFLAQRACKLGRTFSSSMLAEPEEQMHREIQARGALIVMQLTASEIVNDGSGRIETWDHKELPSCAFGKRKDAGGRKAKLLMAV